MVNGVLNTSARDLEWEVLSDAYIETVEHISRLAEIDPAPP
jgi:hypothetical protein